MSKKTRYPLGTFLKKYGGEGNCYEYLVKLRWPNGFVCPKCGHTGCSKLFNGRFQCTQCRHQASVTAGAVMHRTHLLLST